jgi:hypothetical protein
MVISITILINVFEKTHLMKFKIPIYDFNGIINGKGWKGISLI